VATSELSGAWHYPPELLEHVVSAVGRLNRSKDQEIAFFRGAGVPEKYLADIAAQVRADRDSINKYEIARSVLIRLNDARDAMIGPRREILSRIVRTESFEHCWPNDQLAARGAVDAVRKVVHERDAFTRMETEKDRERAERIREKEAEIERRNIERTRRSEVRADLARAFAEGNPWKRGKHLEEVLNRLFALDGISVKEAFHLTGNEGQGVVEQIDGVVAFEGELYLVEMKWLATPVGVPEISQHLVRLMSRSEARGILISASGFSEAAIVQARDFLQHKVAVLCELEEIVRLLERPEKSLTDHFNEKVHAAIAERRPLHRPVIA
jgi:restriction system protein